MFGTSPVTVICPNCDKTVETRITTETMSATHFAACFMCIFFFPLVWLPYVVNEKKTMHYCSNCNEYLNTYEPTEVFTFCNNDPWCCFECADSTIGCCAGDCCEGDCCGDCGNCDCECGGCGDCGDCGDCDCPS